jgi:hypothetical protein
MDENYPFSRGLRSAEELRVQTDELASTRRALEAERERYRDLFEPLAGSTRPTGRRRSCSGSSGSS